MKASDSSGTKQKTRTRSPSVTLWERENSMSKKYDFTWQTMVYGGKLLTKIVALKDFGNVKAGEHGGYLETFHNLSQEGNCWVGAGAIVCGDATVSGSAIVCGEAVVTDRATIAENAVVSGRAQVSGAATVRGRAVVKDMAWIMDAAIIQGTAIASRFARVDCHSVFCSGECS